MKKINWKTLLISVAISLGTGVLAAILSRSGAGFYETIDQPKFLPPSWLFPVVWTALYILMGISAYMIYESTCPSRRRALAVYAAQLAVNFIWTLVFFNARAFLLAFILIIVLWILIVAMIALFHKCRPTAAYLQVPYFLWVTFAAYLTWSIYVLN